MVSETLRIRVSETMWLIRRPSSPARPISTRQLPKLPWTSSNTETLKWAANPAVAAYRLIRRPERPISTRAATMTLRASLRELGHMNWTSSTWCRQSPQTLLFCLRGRLKSQAFSLHDLRAKLMEGGEEEEESQETKGNRPYLPESVNKSVNSSKKVPSNTPRPTITLSRTRLH